MCPGGARSNRAQTAIDFAVGMGVFLIALVFVLAFVPSMFAPFFGMGVGDAMAADRGADYLAENLLVEDPVTPGVLDPDRVDGFFAERCAGDEGEFLADELGLRATSVNVSIGETWTCGPEPDDADTVARRFVDIDGAQYPLRVVVW